jgi:hypothetical protein
MPAMLRSFEVLVAAFLLVATSSGCRQQAASAPTAPPPPPLAPSQPSTVRIISFASFDHSDLVECDDVEIVGTLKPDASAASFEAEVKTLADGIWKSLKPVGTRIPTRLQRSCAEQFTDRRPFATCSDVALWDQQMLRGRLLHYAFADVFRSDWAMKECIERSGTWKATSRESEEFREAQLRFDALEAQRQLKKLMPRE